MSKTQAERASEYRQRKRDEATDKIVTDVCDAVTGKRDVTECDGASVTEDVTPHVGGAGCAAECELHEVVSVAELMEEPNEPIGPLDVYSEQRWAYLQSKGYVWDESSRRGVSTVSGTLATIVVGVTVPGDPAYAMPIVVGV